MKTRFHSWGTGVAMLSMIGLLVPSNISFASAKGKKNTALGLGAVAAQQLLTGKTTNGLLLGAGAAYAYKQYQDAARAEKRQQRAELYQSRRFGGSSLNSRLVFTGRITKDTNDTSRRLIITSNGVERRLYVPTDTPIFLAGASASVHDLRKGDIVRVSAFRRSPTEWTATRINVTSMTGIRRASAYDSYGNAAYNGPYSNDRYTSGVLDRSLATRVYSGVGIVRSVDEETRSFDVQVGNNIRTIYADSSAFHGLQGIGDLREGDRVRVRGNLDGRDVFASDVSLLD